MRHERFDLPLPQREPLSPRPIRRAPARRPPIFGTPLGEGNGVSVALSPRNDVTGKARDYLKIGAVPRAGARIIDAPKAFLPGARLS